MIIIEVALGVVLGFVILANLGEIIAFAGILVLAVIALALAVGAFYLVDDFIPDLGKLATFLFASAMSLAFLFGPGAVVAEKIGEVNLTKFPKYGVGLVLWWLFLFCVFLPVYLQIRSEGGAWGILGWLGWCLGLALFGLSCVWVFNRNQSASSLYFTKLMAPDEVLVKQGIAGISFLVKPGFYSEEAFPEFKQGRAYLTNKRLVAISKQVLIVEVDLGKISKVEMKWSRMLGLIPVAPNSFDVTADSGSVHTYVVPSRGSWVSAIEAQRNHNSR